jgi:hypothetical protein
LRSLYVTSLTVLLVTLVVVLAADWNSIDLTTRALFGGLAVVAAAMLYRITRAYEVAGTQGEGWQEQYIRHVAFTYVALWEGFLILPALRLPYPHLTVPLIVIAVLLIGGTLIDRYKARVLTIRPRPGVVAPQPPTSGARLRGGRRPEQSRVSAR